MVLFFAERDWRVDCPELHKFVGELHDLLSAENMRPEISALPDKAVAQMRESKNYQEDRLRRRREHFELKVAYDARLRDREHDYLDTHCFSHLYIRINTEEEADILAGPLAEYYTEYTGSAAIRPVNRHTDVGEVYIRGLVPWELEQDDERKRFRLIPPLERPSEKFHAFTQLEILTSLVLVHDARREYPLLVRRGHVFSELNGTFGFRLDFIHKSAEDWWVPKLREQLAELNINGESDGPCGNCRWRHNGEIIEVTMQVAAWRMCRHLWKQPDRTATFDELKMPVYSDPEHIADANAYGSLRREANNAFEANDIPWRASLKKGTAYLKPAK